jgi:hypothetical protein
LDASLHFDRLVKYKSMAASTLMLEGATASLPFSIAVAFCKASDQSVVSADHLFLLRWNQTGQPQRR